MGINMTMAGQLILAYLIVIIFTVVYSFKLAKRKSQHPKVVLFVSIALAFVPPWCFFYLGLLALKEDREPGTTSE